MGVAAAVAGKSKSETTRARRKAWGVLMAELLEGGGVGAGVTDGADGADGADGLWPGGVGVGVMATIVRIMYGINGLSQYYLSKTEWFIFGYT